MDMGRAAWGHSRSPSRERWPARRDINTGTSSGIPNSQNVVLVYDPKEKYFNRTGAETHRNDGGPQSPNFPHALEPVKRGEIVAYEHRDAYTYVAADLTPAYSSVRDDEKTKKRTQSQKLNDFTRQFIYVRGTPEFFVIYDRVRATDAAFPKTWVTHLAGSSRKSSAPAIR